MIRVFLSSIVCLVIFTSITNIEAQEEILPLKGENVKDWHAIAAALISNGRYEEAISYYDHILEINPDDQKALLNKGSVLIELNRIEEAIKYVEKNFSNLCIINPELPPQLKDGIKFLGKPEPKMFAPTPTTVPVLNIVFIPHLE